MWQELRSYGGGRLGLQGVWWCRDSGSGSCPEDPLWWRGWGDPEPFSSSHVCTHMGREEALGLGVIHPSPALHGHLRAEPPNLPMGHSLTGETPFGFCLLAAPSSWTGRC